MGVFDTRPRAYYVTKALTDALAWAHAYHVSKLTQDAFWSAEFDRRLAGELAVVQAKLAEGGRITAKGRPHYDYLVSHNLLTPTPAGV